jgi:hypothetical protein
MTVRTEFGGLLDDVVDTFRGSETAKLLVEAGNALSKRADARKKCIDDVRQRVELITGVEIEPIRGEFESLASFGMAEAAIQERVARWLQRATQKGGE